MSYKIAAILATVIATAACQQNPGTQGPATTQASARSAPVAALCPRAGTTVQAERFSFVHGGVDPSDPERCLVGQQSWYFGLTTIPERGHLMRAVFPPAVGRQGSRTIQSSTGFWRETVEVVEETRVTVPAGTFDVWVIRLVNEQLMGGGGAGRGVITYYMERGTGLTVRRDVTFNYTWPGAPAPFQAQSITRPPG